MRLQRLHGLRRLELLVREREQDDTHDDRERDDGHCPGQAHAVQFSEDPAQELHHRFEDVEHVGERVGDDEDHG